MKLSLYIKDERLRSRSEYVSMCEELAASGFEFEEVTSAPLSPDTDMVLSIGGDGTFLSASRMASEAGVPVAGVNFGRMGFLSEFRPNEIASVLCRGGYFTEDLELLDVFCGGKHWNALNDISVLRSGAAMLGVDVCIDGIALPTYWGDGLLVSTSAGSTAYSLSVGGPICTPDAKVFIIAPVAPHNLNVRPLVVPSSSELELRFKSRDRLVNLTCDNIGNMISSESSVSVSVAQFSLKRLRLSKASFIEALRSKLFWGEDIRNEAK